MRYFIHPTRHPNPPRRRALDFFGFKTWFITLLVVAGLAFVGLHEASLLARPQKTNQTTNEATPQTVHMASEIVALPIPEIALPKRPVNPPTIFAKAYIVIDNHTKYPLLAKNADTPASIASTTKVMTALVALDTYDLNKILTVTPGAAGIEGSSIGLVKNETLTVENLLYALLLNSANDAAYTLADGLVRREAFVAQMNEKARLLGLQHTDYKDPAGLDDSGHSTPRDLALLLNYALDNPTFRMIVGTASHTITSVGGQFQHELKNSNRLIQPDEPLFYPYVIGGKTGFTFDAGHCLIAASELPDKQRYIAVVLNTQESTNDASAKEARKLLVWANQN